MYSVYPRIAIRLLEKPMETLINQWVLLDSYSWGGTQFLGTKTTAVSVFRVFPAAQRFPARYRMVRLVGEGHFTKVWTRVGWDPWRLVCHALLKERMCLIS